MPGSGEAASYGDLLITSLVVLGGVCIAAFVVVRVLGRFLATGSRRGAHLLDIVARMPLEPRRSLYVVDVAGKTLLVGTSEMGLSVLTELDREAVHARVVERPTFAELVRTAWAKRKSRGSAPTERPDGMSPKPEPIDKLSSANAEPNGGDSRTTTREPGESASRRESGESASAGEPEEPASAREPGAPASAREPGELASARGHREPPSARESGESA